MAFLRVRLSVFLGKSVFQIKGIVFSVPEKA